MKKESAFEEILSGDDMGEYQDKIKKHFWILVCSSVSEIGDEEAYRKMYEPIYKIKPENAIKLVEDQFWSTLYVLARKIRDPNELRAQLEPVVQLEVKKVREHIWKLLTFFLSETCDESTFREALEPLVKVNSKEAVKLVEDHLWKTLYSLARKNQDPKELRLQLEPIVEIDVKRAADAIKEDNPEKYKFLQILR